MYLGFIAYNEYLLVLYAFHKFESAALFAAYSITIYDWSYVLRDIEKDSIYPFMTRKVSTVYFFGDKSLISLNVVYFSISLTNFIYICASDNLTAYLNSYVYVVGIFVQISAAFLLISAMLHAGIRLYVRIRGVTGSLDTNRFAGPNLTRSLSTTHPGVSTEFRMALRSLILVMATCSVCVFIQMMILILNYALGYANQTGAYVGPFFFYWYATF